LPTGVEDNCDNGPQNEGVVLVEVVGKVVRATGLGPLQTINGLDYLGFFDWGRKPMALFRRETRIFVLDESFHRRVPASAF
jgi:hypothetical protein